MPLTLKPGPDTPICEMVTLVPPALVIVERKELVFPTVTLPKLRLEGVEVSRPGATAVPETGRVSDGLEALEATLTDPETLPAD